MNNSTKRNTLRAIFYTSIFLMVIGFIWMQLNKTQSTLSDVISFLSVIGILGVIGSGTFLLLNRPTADWGREPVNLTSEFVGTVLGLLLVAHAIANWTSADYQYFMSPLIFIGVIVGIMIFHQKRSTGWRRIAQGISNVNPRDEREVWIAIFSSSVTFTITILAILAVATVLLSTPPIGKGQLVDLLVGTTFILVSVRGFIAWRMGLK